MRLQCLDHVALTVGDVRRSVAWYTEVLGLERAHEAAWGEAPAVVAAGGTGLALFQADAERPAAPPGGDVPTMRHVAFRVDRPGFEEAQRDLRRLRVDFTFEDHQVSHSIYVLDPDGHRVEITTYEV